MIIGWDISSSIIGVAKLRDDGSFIGAEHCDLRKVDGDLLEKSDAAEGFVEGVIREARHEPALYNFVEDRLGSFSAGRTMLQTLMRLAAFNSTVSYLIWRASRRFLGFNRSRVEHIHPSRAKSLVRRIGLVVPKGGDKKRLTLDFLRGRELGYSPRFNRNGKPQPWCYDEADAYVVAHAGLISMGDRCKESGSSGPSGAPSVSAERRARRPSSGALSTRRGRAVPRGS